MKPFLRLRNRNPVVIKNLRTGEIIKDQLKDRGEPIWIVALLVLLLLAIGIGAALWPII